MNKVRKSFLLWVALPGVAIPIVVAFLFRFPEFLPLGAWVRDLPLLHAAINGTTAILLIAALWAIKQRRPSLHKRMIYACLGLGTLFLMSYVLYHGSVPSTKYGDTNADGLLSLSEQAVLGIWRIVYLILLTSHIVLSIFVVFLVLLALHYARTHKFKRHKAIVRYAFPIWLYVSMSGVLVYIMIRPFYPNG